MALGPGKYDKLATWLRERAKADGVILIVLGGDKGDGFEAHLPAHSHADSMLRTVAMLREMASQIEADVRRVQS